jgi:uncharacterized membrane protein YsdA (DUF1294 family)
VIQLALIYLPVINAITWLAFWADKERARQGLYRIPERTLLLLALAGGSPAAIHAQQRLRHKTRKQPFASILVGIPVLQIAALIGLALLRA